LKNKISELSKENHHHKIRVGQKEALHHGPPQNMPLGMKLGRIASVRMVKIRVG